MKNLSLRLLSLLLVGLWCATATAQVYPNIPANTLLGRLGSGNPGPPQAIQFSTIAKQISSRHSVKDFGAKGDTKRVTDGVAIISNPAFTSATASFTSADIGKPIRIVGAGTASATLQTTIATVTNTTTITLTVAPSTSVNPATFWYGTDDTASIQSAIVNATATKDCVYIPYDLYTTTSTLIMGSATCIYGDGSSIATVTGSLIIPDITTDAININGGGSALLRDFGIYYPSLATNATNAAVNVDRGDTNYNYYSSFLNLSIFNSYNAFRFKNAAYPIIDGIKVQEFGNAGVIIEDGNGYGDIGNPTIVNSKFLSFTAVPNYCVYWTSAGGLKYHSNDCIGPATGVIVNVRAGTDLTQVSIIGNSFDTTNNAGVEVLRQSTTGSLQELIFNGNTCNSTANCLYIPTDATGVWVNTITAIGNSVRGSNSATAKLFNINSANNINITGNAMSSGNAGTIGINIGSAATNVVVGPNSYSGTFANTLVNASASYKTSTAAVPTSGTILTGNGTDWLPTTTTWPATTTINRLLWSSGTNTISDLATAASGILATSAGGVPSIGSTIPANMNIQGNINLTGAAASFRTMQFQTSASNRWVWAVDNAAESGANAGSNIGVNSYDDSGNFLATVWQITRSSGANNFPITTDSTSASTGAVTLAGGMGALKNVSTGSHFLNASAAPTLSSCGTGSPTATTGSTNQGGQFTVGGGTIATCTVTFNSAYPNYAFCTISAANSTAAGVTILPYISASSKTAFTVTSTAASMAGAVFNYSCQGS